MGQHYKDISAIALARRDAALPREYLLPSEVLKDLPLNLTTVPRSSGHFTPSELEIIESEADVILPNIKSKKWSSLAVTKAFCKAAVVAQQLTNCLTEVLIPEALARAKALDEHLESTGEVIGPLHGLPISLKDCLITPPHPSSIGMACYANKATIPEEQTVLVTLLAKLGAVFYVKTATPTAMMMMETISAVWGETRGAYHSGTSPGGSSGGEGALLAMRGSPLGVGTDIGGSIRIPSAFNYLYGLKPTFGRFPVHGAKSGISGQDFIYSNNGPMARSLESLKLYCAVVLSDSVKPWLYDPKCLPVPWKTSSQISPPGRKLRFGIISDNDGEYSVQPPIVRGLATTKAALLAAGHEVFEWEPTDHPEIIHEVNSSFHTLGGAAIMGLTKENEEPVYGSMKAYEETYKKGEGLLGPTQLRAMIAKRNALQKAYLDRWTATATVEKGPMDALILPASTWTAPRLGFTQEMFCVNYTGVFNLLGKLFPSPDPTSSCSHYIVDYPACTFPVGFADKALDPKRPADWKPLNENDKLMNDDYDPEFYHGTPITLQCVTRRLEDEKLLECVGIITEALNSSSS